MFQGLEIFTEIIDDVGGTGAVGNESKAVGNDPIPNTRTTLSSPEAHQSDSGRASKGGGAVYNEDGGKEFGKTRPRSYDGETLDESLSDSKYVPEEPPLTPDVVPIGSRVGRESAGIVSQAEGSDEPLSDSRFVPREPPLSPEATPARNGDGGDEDEDEQRADRGVNCRQPLQQPRNHGWVWYTSNNILSHSAGVLLSLVFFHRLGQK